MTDQAVDIRDAFFDRLYDIASTDRDLLFLTADMGAFSLERFKKDMPAQYINMGISEQNMMNVAAGLTLGGKKVFAYAIAPFATMRCFEQIKVSISGMGLAVTIVGAGPGITYASDGPTHHATQDIAIMRALPGMVILNPSDPVMARNAADIAFRSDKPVYVRIDKGRIPAVYPADHEFDDGLSVVRQGCDVFIITTGLMVHKALAIADILEKKSISTGVLDVYRLKPVDARQVLEYAGKYRRIVTLEEHSIVGGLGSIVAEMLADHAMVIPMKRFALDDAYHEGYGDREWMHGQNGLDDNSIIERIRTWR